MENTPHGSFGSLGSHKDSVLLQKTKNCYSNIKNNRNSIAYCLALNPNVRLSWAKKKLSLGGKKITFTVVYDMTTASTASVCVNTE